MLVQILKSTPEKSWYRKKILQIFDVIDTDDERMIYLLSPMQLKKMKKAPHLEIGIMKEDCIKVDDETLEKYSISNILKAIDGQ